MTIGELMGASIFVTLSLLICMYVQVHIDESLSANGDPNAQAFHWLMVRMDMNVFEISRCSADSGPFGISWPVCCCCYGGGDDAGTSGGVGRHVI